MDDIDPLSDEDLSFDRQLAILGGLSSAVREALVRLEADKKATEDRIHASVQKMRWFRRAALLAIAASALSLWNAHEANHAADDANRAVAAVVAQRTESRRISCNDANDTADKINLLQTSTRGIVLLATQPYPNRTPAQQEAVDTFLRQSSDLLDKAVVTKRDCSDRAIAEYYGETNE